MTKTALNKIVLTFGCLALFVIGSLMIQELTINEASAEVEQPCEARQSETNRKDIAASFLNGNDVDPSALAATCFSLQLDASIPHEFAKEAFDPTDFKDCYASGNSLSFTYAGNSDAARSFCEEKLQAKGWIPQDGSSELLTSYAKPSGVYNWLVLQFIEIGGKTVVLATTVDPLERECLP